MRRLKKEAKNKGDKGKVYLNNADFQRTTQRDKKVFFNEQCIKLEENNSRRKTRDLFRKIGDIKRTFCPKMGTIKDINGKDLVDTEEIKKRWKEYMEELYKKDPNELDYYDGVVSHPEPDILECKVEWALGSTAVNKASECDGIPVELFKAIKDDSIKVLHSICQKIWKTQHWSQDWKGQSSSQFPRRVVLKNVLTIRQLHSSPMLVRSRLNSCLLGFRIM